MIRVVPPLPPASRDTPGREGGQWLTEGSVQPYCPYQSAA
jgi:hypothetical protein